MRRARKLAVGCVAAGTFGAGIVLAWYLFRPGVLASVTTPQLLLIVGLFALPLLALATWEFERRARHAAPVARPAHRDAMSHAPIARDDGELRRDFADGPAGEIAVGDDDVMAAGVDERGAGLASAGVAPERVLVVEPRIDVARELLELMPCETETDEAREVVAGASGHAAATGPDHAPEDLPRHRHAAHPRRRAAEGVG